jgi:fatty acid desaturase
MTKSEPNQKPKRKLKLLAAILTLLGVIVLAAAVAFVLWGMWVSDRWAVIAIAGIASLWALNSRITRIADLMEQRNEPKVASAPVHFHFESNPTTEELARKLTQKMQEGK